MTSLRNFQRRILNLPVVGHTCYTKYRGWGYPRSPTMPRRARIHESNIPETDQPWLYAVSREHLSEGKQDGLTISQGMLNIRQTRCTSSQSFFHSQPWSLPNSSRVSQLRMNIAERSKSYAQGSGEAMDVMLYVVRWVPALRVVSP